MGLGVANFIDLDDKVLAYASSDLALHLVTNVAVNCRSTVRSIKMVP